MKLGLCSLSTSSGDLKHFSLPNELPSSSHPGTCRNILRVDVGVEARVGPLRGDKQLSSPPQMTTQERKPIMSELESLWRVPGSL